MYDRENLLRDLKENVVEVTFTKVNGDRRVMRCTLMQKLLPPNVDMHYLEEEHRKPHNLNLIAVWDVQNGGWRSFRVDSVEYAEAIEGYF